MYFHYHITPNFHILLAINTYKYFHKPTSNDYKQQAINKYFITLSIDIFEKITQHHQVFHSFNFIKVHINHIITTLLYDYTYLQAKFNKTTSICISFFSKFLVLHPCSQYSSSVKFKYNFILSIELLF